MLTIDVITPIVDDPRAFGGIAAANALSDVYAMGGAPQVALSFVGFPTDKLPLDMLGEVLAGAADACSRARCPIVGGHTIADAEPKYGLAVVGSVDADRAWTQTRARAGDALVLTKRLGTGLFGQAVRKGIASESLTKQAVLQMLRLNDTARDVGLALGATSCTDVTGFGLLGHLRHLVEASNLAARIESASVPILPDVLGLAEQGVVPGGSKRNLDYALAVTAIDDAIGEPMRIVLADAQTSGGLLLCLPRANAAEAIQRLEDAGCEGASLIGELSPYADGPRIRVA